MAATNRTLNIVIAALGGEGGGTLASWIEETAHQLGWFAQTTSIAGVAQRTGATIYYIELFPGRKDQSAEPERAPVMSAFPAPGNIDIAISSEIAEAGRLIQRGFCTKDRTTLIASNHHIFGITEKMILDDGRVDTTEIAKVAAQQCKQLISFDMKELAERNNTVISATLFGALAGSKALPFAKQDYESVIEQTGKMVENNLAAFRASYNQAIAPPSLQVEVSPKPSATDKASNSLADVTSARAFALPEASTEHGRALLSKIEQGFPASCYEVLTHGVERLLDYQDADYAHQYLDELAQILAVDAGEGEHELTKETARHLALWMSFEDTARVAQIKTRASRQDKIREEVRAESDQIFHVTEFFAPRLEELCQPLPAGIARAIIASPLCRKLAGPLTKGKRLRTDTMIAFTVLRMMAFTRKWRRKQYTYAHEHKQIQTWLSEIKTYAERDQRAALEIALSARIVKGYGATRERGSGQIDNILAACNANICTADKIKQLTISALSDDSGENLASELLAAN